MYFAVYINHRPVFGLSSDQLEQAFRVLGEPDAEGNPSIDRGHLLYLLQNKGRVLVP